VISEQIRISFPCFCFIPKLKYVISNTKLADRQDVFTIHYGISTAGIWPVELKTNIRTCNLFLEFAYQNQNIYSHILDSICQFGNRFQFWICL